MFSGFNTGRSYVAPAEAGWASRFCVGAPLCLITTIEPPPARVAAPRRCFNLPRVDEKSSVVVASSRVRDESPSGPWFYHNCTSIRGPQVHLIRSPGCVAASDVLRAAPRRIAPSGALLTRCGRALLLSTYSVFPTTYDFQARTPFSIGITFSRSLYPSFVLPLLPFAMEHLRFPVYIAADFSLRYCCQRPDAAITLFPRFNEARLYTTFGVLLSLYYCWMLFRPLHSL